MPLPQFTYRRRRYYIDHRLRQFRSIPPGHGIIEFVEFESGKGRRMLAALARAGVTIRDVHHD